MTLEHAIQAAREAYLKVARTPGPDGNLYDACQAAIDALKGIQARIVAIETADVHREIYDGTYPMKDCEAMKQRQAQINLDHEAAERKVRHA